MKPTQGRVCECLKAMLRKAAQDLAEMGIPSPSPLEFLAGALRAGLAVLQPASVAEPSRGPEGGRSSRADEASFGGHAAVIFVNRKAPEKWLVDINPHLNDVHQRVPN